ncbi:hypothetical protein GCM10025876_17450 [Demequina litorisediminis]|uniref:DUF4829 domain-containing protein n=2 Tax=Demequina litorisediminis TaxID=1849022 RepID=A0ABQ6IDQ0_9MICO|nr:hypothetical protein GCM10025876_17450 [Demequina litorisediminis]
MIGVAAAALTYPWGSTDVPLPEATAEPVEVVASYVAALDAHDCDTAVALAAPSFAETARDWCRKVAGLGNLEIGVSLDEDPAWSGLSADTEVVSVTVDFDLDWRLFRSDVSMPEGATTWGYRLARASVDEPWRIVDNGVG